MTNDKRPVLIHPSVLIPHPSSLIPHPSSLIPHPSSLRPHPSSLIPIQLGKLSIKSENKGYNPIKSPPVNTVRTVSDTKRAFYNLHTRPVHSIYRRVVEELMVEMHLLSVNVDFHYNPIYALGVVTAFDRFMQGYQPTQDRESIFNALCRSIEDAPDRYQQDATRLRELATNLSGEQIVGWLSQTLQPEETRELQEQVRAIADNSKFKYSRLFAIGLLGLIEQASPDLVKDDARRGEALKQICTALHLPEDRMQKDLELYRSNLEKLVQARIVLDDTLKADRKKREERAQAKNASSTPSETPVMSGKSIDS